MAEFLEIRRSCLMGLPMGQFSEAGVAALAGFGFAIGVVIEAPNTVLIAAALAVRISREVGDGVEGETGLPVEEQVRKEWDPSKGGLPTFLV